jgi:NTP pyrophosphatase (non-canonical NTP hydrolase)
MTTWQSRPVKDAFKDDAERLQKLQDEIVEWSTATFGDRRTTAIPVINHLEKEAQELIDELKSNGNYQEEFADCFMLLIDAAKTCGISTDELISLTFSKLEKNKKRKWGQPDEQGVIRHTTEQPND